MFSLAVVLASISIGYLGQGAAPKAETVLVIERATAGDDRSGRGRPTRCG
jgi:hypothetical protein